MQIPGVHIETIVNPARYTAHQLELACAIAGILGRGRFVLCEWPQWPEPPS